MKDIFIQLWTWDGNPSGASLHINDGSFKSWKKRNAEITLDGELKEVKVSKSIFFEVLYNDGFLELGENSLNNLIALGEIKMQEDLDVA